MVNRTGIALLLILTAVNGRAQQRPAFGWAGNVVTAELPPSILADSKVSRQLVSGLTTTFLLVVRQRPHNPSNAARMEIRYDLWDEVWHVRRVEYGRPAEQQRLASRQILESWWRAPIRLFAATGTPAVFDLELRVLPFSAAEEEEARAWISKSGGVGTSAPTSGLVDALIGTTIAAKPIRTWRWGVRLSQQ